MLTRIVNPRQRASVFKLVIQNKLMLTRIVNPRQRGY